MKFIRPYFEIISDDFTRSKVLRRIENAARVCYKSEDNISDGSDVRILKNLIKNDHTAMIEHAPNLSVKFVCDRGVSHELVRHRLASFAQESTRYVNYNNKNNGSLTFIIPNWISAVDCDLLMRFDFTENIIDEMKSFIHDKNVLTYLYFCLNAENTYMSLIRGGWTPEEARTVLPNSIKTEIVVTANVREWRTIFKLRCDDKHAHPQMVELMTPLYDRLNDEIPELWSDIMTKNNEVENEKKDT